MSTLAYREPPSILKLVAHEVRWQLLLALAYSDYRVNELGRLLQKPLNLISYHLRLLRSAAIVQERRSSADARDVYYSLDLEHFQTLYKSAVESLHPALADAQLDRMASTTATGYPPVRVLFLCTHNSARSQMAEALLRHLGQARVEVSSAGTQATTVHLQALETLRNHGIDTTGLHSKHLGRFLGQDFDYVITVCDRASESCPIFPGDPERIHWSFPDPSAFSEPDEQKGAFLQVFAGLEKRLKIFLTLIDRNQKAG